MGGVFTSAVLWKVLCFASVLLFPHAVGEELKCSPAGTCLWNMTIPPSVNHDTSPTAEDFLMHLTARKTNSKDGTRKGRLKSPVLLSSPGCKVVVEQELLGSTTEMAVKQIEAERGFPVRRLVLRGSDVGGKQRRQDMRLYYPKPTYVIIEGAVEDGGVLLLRSAELDSTCQFHHVSSSSSCGDDEYNCFFTPVCIKQEKVCDFVLDCPDGDDEAQCGITDFEKDMGGWYESSNYNPPYVWTWGAAEEAPYPGGSAPDHDHTVGSTGHFMWAPGITAVDSSATAVAEAPLVGPVVASCTVSFWYQRKGGMPGLRFILNTDGFFMDVDLPEVNDLEWHQMKFEIGAHEKLSLEFISNWYRQDFEYNDVCIDDIDMLFCSSDTPPFEDEMRCNFNDEYDVCRLYQSHDDDANWAMTYDYRNPEDGFMRTTYLGGNQTLQTWWYSKRGSFCVSFSYKLDESTDLRVALVKEDAEEELWRRQVPLLAWRTQHLQLTSDTIFQIHFRSRTAEEKYAYLDNVFLLDGSCPVSLTCTFDDGDDCPLKDFTDGTATLTWKLGSGDTTANDAPPDDHTWMTSAGQYLYLPLQPQEEGQKAYVKSHNISTTTTPEGDCLQFWYYLYSKSQSSPVGEIGIRRLLKDSIVTDRIWERSYDQHPEWQFGAVTIKHEEDFSILLEGLRHTGTEGGIAWDDITIARGKCDNPGDCTFENGLCGWKDQEYDDATLSPWEWGKAQYVPGGPASDHTFLSGQGHYVIAIVESCSSGRCAAHLDSMEVIAEQTIYCLTFYASVLQFGDNNYLAIDVLNVEENLSQNEFMLKQSDEQSWTLHSLILSHLPPLFQVRFRAETLPSLITETAYIAIDDVQLTPGPCQDVSTPYPVSTPSPDTLVTCDFEGNSLCGWSQDTNDGDQWHLTTGETIDNGLSFENDKLGPFVDHTTELSSGHFLYINNKRSAGNAVRLISEPVPLDTPHCFSFNYYLHGSHTPVLNLYIIGDESKYVPDWSAVGEHGELWQLMRISISNQTKVMQHLVLEAYQELSITEDTSHLAIDDFVLTDGSCLNAGFGITCEFEAADLCEYVVLTEEGEGGWTRVNAEENNVPATDHTYMSAVGHYLFLDFTPGNMTTSSVVSPFLPKSDETVCVQWYYYIDGPDNMTASLRVYLRSSGAKQFSKEGEVDYWEVTEPEGPNWHLGQMDVQSVGNMYVEFQGRTESFSEATIIALDDVSSMARACPAPATCSFESGMCGWHDSGINEDMPWLMNNGPTPTPNTGPSVDHTLGSQYGHYMYISASSGYEGARAQLISELIPSGEYCFEFYFYMSGMNMGGLAIYMNVTEGETYQVFNRSGDQGEKWQLALISIAGMDDFSLCIEGVAGSWVESDIAVDDTWTSVGFCEEIPDQYICLDGKAIPEEKICDFIMDCSAGDDENKCGTCNFELGMCGWRALNSSTYVWTVGQNMTTSESDDDVVYDHTMGTEDGHFLYVAEEPSDEGGPAVLASSHHHNSQVQCTLFFWYRENSNEAIGRNIILTVSVRRDEDVTPLAYIVNKQNNKWKQEEVRLQDWQGSFEILIEASTTAGYSDLTVDDISFMNCGLLHEEADCLHSQFKCYETGVCVDAAVKCDNTNDCGDKSDEFDCDVYDPVCTFEDGQPCYWIQEPDQDDMDWRLGSGPTPIGKYSHLTGPPVDHTTRLDTGRYMYVTQEPSKEINMKRAWLVSPVVEALRGETCVLRFHYYMYGKNVQSLNVYQTLTKHGNKQLIFSKNGELGQFWNRAIVYSSTLQQFQFIIEGITNIGDYSDIAVDDLSFVGCIMLNETLPPGTTSLPPTDPCSDNEFYCNVGNECVPLSLRCNWQDDCSNGADEDECGDCDFESGMCSWYDDSVGIFQWKRLRAGDISAYDHPNVDHTFANSTGHILYIEGSDGVAGKTAVLKSPTILQNGGRYCELHFWLYQRMTMNVKLIPYVVSDVLHLQIDDFITTGPREEVWYNVILPIPNMSSNYYFTLDATPVFDEGSAWADSHSILAIDDVEYFDCSSNSFGLDCNFDDISHHQGFCMWRASADCQHYWKHSARFPVALSDHTTGQSFYIYVDFSDESAVHGNYARLESAVQFNSSSNGHFLTLWYYMYGENVGTFRIIQRLRNEPVNNTYLDLSGPQDDRWNLFNALLDTNTYFSIILEAEWGDVGQGILAVDDVVMTSDLDLQICDFQIDFCRWTLQPGNTSWERTRGKDQETGCPPLDHSDNSEMGYYAYLVPTGREGDSGYLYSPTFENVGSQCLRIWYYLDAGDADRIRITALDVETAKVVHITTLHSSTHNMWTLGLATISSIDKFSVIIEGITGSSFGNAAIDDLEFVQGTCPDPYECDFEYDTCGWSNIEAQDTFDWQRSSGGEGSGILVDHTINYETGHYMVARVANKKVGDSAKLVGVIIPASLSCITFWYSMQDIYGATLTVILSDDSNDIPIAVYYNSSQDQLWNQATVNRVITSDVFRISLQIDVLQDQDSSDRDSVGIDDIAFTADCNVATLPPYQATPPPTHMPTIFDCDFEQENARFCAWDQDLSAGIDWKIGQGDTPSEGTGPPTDHTFLTEEGHYIFVSTIAQQNRSARLNSPIISPGEEGACLSFWYHMHGPNIGSLQVLLNTSGNKKIFSMWQRTHEQGRDWMQAKLYIGYESYGSQVIIEATTHSQGRGDIALDDIQLDFKECSYNLLCSFEEGMCNFEQSVNDNLDWKLVSKISSEGNSDFKPLADHSQQTPVGHYLELEGEGSGIVYTDKYHPVHKCVQFWFFSDGPVDSGHSALSVHLYSNDQENPMLLLTVNDTFSSEWTLYRLPLDTAFFYSVAFQGDLHNGSVFGLDDVQPLMTCEPWTECTFETDFCIWKNSDKDDDMDWSLTTASHLTSIYGPNVDITLRSPYAGFVYFEPSVSGGKAILETFSLGPGTWCLSFWTHLQSLERISLSVILQDRNSEDSQILWENHEVIHADWKFEQVSLNVTGSLERIFFLADSSVPSTGVIALDQISVNRDQCSNMTVPECDMMCDLGICVSSEQMCNFIQDCTQGQDENFCGYNCTFEQADDDHCTWNSISENTNGELSWILLQGQNSNDTLGPSVDHTLLTKQGHYTALVPKTLAGADAHGPLFRSPILYNSAAECRLTFWYVLYELPSTDPGFLRVSYNTSDVTTLLLDIIPTRREEWMYGIVYIGRLRTRFSLFFEGNRNLLVDGFTAIDDIKFEKCFLPSVNQTNCQQFTCDNRACVSIFDKCDFVDNCGDYSDEDDNLAQCSMYVGRCNFEDGSFCSWESRDGEWQLGSPSSKNIIPSRDHTLNSALGSFIYIESTEMKYATKEATLASPVVLSSSVLCHLRFYYFMDGSAVDKLVISARDSSNGPLDVLEVIPGPIGQLWERAEVILTVHKVLQVLITGSLSNDTTGTPSVIAIDDISFTSECTSSDSTLPTMTSPVSTTNKDYCENQYTCLNEKCIPFTNVCDFKNDCGDNTDEKLCAECDFEFSQCGWEDKSFGKNRWQRVDGSPYGREHYVMRVIGDGNGVEENANLVSVSLGASSASCTMSFYYYLQSTDSVLELRLLSGSTQIMLWSTSEDTDNTWYQETVGIMKRGSNWQLQYRINKLATEGLIMIDDIHFQGCALSIPQNCRDDQFSCDNGYCINTTQICDFSDDCGDNTDESVFTCQTYAERCNFETDYCNWEQDQHDDLDFIRKNGDTLSEGVGPDYDHTYGNESGYYMYLQSVEGSDGKYAKIASPSFIPSDGSCHFRFWYIIKKGKNASLSVYVQESSQNADMGKQNMSPSIYDEGFLWTKEDNCIFQSSGNANYLWTFVDLAITFTRFFKIVMEAWAGKEITGDVSIDDLSFSSECHRSQCMTDEFQCYDKTRCIPQEKWCDFQFDCEDKSDEEDCFMNCSFEENQCGWKEGDNDGYNWIRAKAADAASGTDQTGPFVDKNGSEDGHFLLLHEDDSALQGQIGETYSHWYQNSKSECLFVFWYYMSKDIGTYVMLRLNSSQEDFIYLALFDEESVIGDVWTFSSTSVGRRTVPFQLSFYSVKMDGVSGIFAVDETSFQYCGFTDAQCTSDTYQCKATERCIHKTALCDMVDDCGDGEDEREETCSLFLRITLENEGELGWFTQGEDGVEDDAEWLLGTGDSTSIDKAPNYDHTQWSRAGRYLFMDVPQMESRTARLVSRFIQPGPECSFTFYFNMYRDRFGTLTIFFRKMDGSVSVYSEIKPPYSPLLYNVWRKYSIPRETMPLDQYFQIILDATSLAEHVGTIALDDFVFHLDCSIFNGTVSPPPPASNCTREEFQCSDGSCVPLSKKCNFVSDCPFYDSSDEDGCVSTNCTFEGEDLCGWTIEATDVPVREKLQETRYPNETEILGEKIIRFTWQVSTGSSPVDTPLQTYKPGQDHTTDTSSGCYLYTYSEAGNFEASTELATSFYFGETAKTCRLSFWYWWSGPEDGSLHVVVRPSQGSAYEVWVTDGNQGNAWQLAEVGVGDLNQSALSIQASRGVVYEGGGAVDDVYFLDCLPPTLPPDGYTCEEMDMYSCTDGNCITGAAVCDYSHDCFDDSDEVSEVCRLYMYRCNFESGITRDWEQDVDDDTQWVLQEGASGLGLETLPEFDHTHGSSVGHYVVMDVETASDPEVVSRLHSPVILGSVSECELRFWYLATGTQYGLLRIYRRTSYYSDGSVLLATVSDVARNIWLKYTIAVDDVDMTVEDFQVVIEGVSPAGRDGFIVLDDLSMTPSCERSFNQDLPGGNQVTTPQPVCPQGQLMCLNGNCYNPIEACNFLDDCGDNTDELFCTKSCDFETEDMCGWFENSASSAHWERFSFPAEPPGPTSDHNNGKASHALKTVSEGSPGRVAILESAKFSTVGAGCTVSFYHFHNGTGTEGVTLSLYMKAEDVDNDDHSNLLWLEDSYSANWKRENVEIGGQRNFILYFEAVHSDGTSFAALDDIDFISCIPSGECHSVLDYECADGSCIPYQYACDAKYDCRDKSDEYMCAKLQGDCDFDQTNWTEECGWVQSEEDDKDWQVANASPNSSFGPTQDHTLGGRGYYLYMDNQQEPPGRIASIRTGVLYSASEGICYVRFWYYIHNDETTADTGALRLFREVGNGHRYLLLTRSGNYMSKWLEEVVPVSSKSSFFLLLEAETGGAFQTYIALDDFSVTPACVTGTITPPSNTSCQSGELPCANGECVAEAFFCDCFMDCIDGSDEDNCSSVTCNTMGTRTTTTTITTSTSRSSTTPIPSPCEDTEFFCGDEASTCLPALLMCDGLADCPNLADETNCPGTRCDAGYVYCGDVYMGDRPCMSVDYLCDGLIFCNTHEADESMCGICPSHYCVNNGVCEVSGDTLPQCSCKHGYEGVRCEKYSAPPDQNSGLTGEQIAGITIGVALAVTLAGFIIFAYSTRGRRSSPHRRPSDVTSTAGNDIEPVLIGREAGEAYPLETIDQPCESET